MKIYGKYGFSGQHDDEPEAVPNIYYPRRKTFFNDVNKFLTEDQKKEVIEKDI